MNKTGKSSLHRGSTLVGREKSDMASGQVITGPVEGVGNNVGETGSSQRDSAFGRMIMEGFLEEVAAE